MSSLKVRSKDNPFGKFSQTFPGVRKVLVWTRCPPLGSQIDAAARLDLERAGEVLGPGSCVIDVDGHRRVQVQKNGIGGGYLVAVTLRN